MEMKGKRSMVDNGSQEKNCLFNQANAAWDNGDMRQAFALFLQAARLGDVSSQLDLGYFFDQGLSVKKDKKKALEWYRRAYRQGDAGAANNIATIYRDLGDTRKMLWWFRRAAAMGDIDVLLDLGKRYEKGLTVPRNPAKAKVFYRRVLANKWATKDDKSEATARLVGLRERKRQLDRD
jgi:TPR repeat protein